MNRETKVAQVNRGNAYLILETYIQKLIEDNVQNTLCMMSTLDSFLGYLFQTEQNKVILNELQTHLMYSKIDKMHFGKHTF